MDNSVPGHRGFERLYLILHETANWTVILPHGAVRCETASLRMALDKAMELALRGSEVDALVRRGSSEIVLFSDQVRELTNYLAEPEPRPEPRVARIVNGGLGGIDDVRSLMSPNGTGYGDATVENAVSAK
jgi:hypothetical protein